MKNRIDEVIQCLNHALVALATTKAVTIDAYEGLERDLARALDAAGHLMPDLPEPDERTQDDPTWWPKRGLNYGHVRRGANTVTIARGDGSIRLTPHEANELGLFLLAAAHHERTKE